MPNKNPLKSIQNENMVNKNPLRTATFRGKDGTIKKVKYGKMSLRELAGLTKNDRLLVKDGIPKSEKEIKKICTDIGSNYLKEVKDTIKTSINPENELKKQKMKLHGGFMVRKNISNNVVFKEKMSDCRKIALNEMESKGTEFIDKLKEEIDKE